MLFWGAFGLSLLLSLTLAYLGLRLIFSGDDEGFFYQIPVAAFAVLVVLLLALFTISGLGPREGLFCFLIVTVPLAAYLGPLLIFRIARFCTTPTPDNRPLADRYSRAEAAERFGRFDEAREEYRRLIEEESLELEPRRRLAEFFRRRREFDEAVLEVQAALDLPELPPEKAVALGFLLVDLLVEAGRTAEAGTHLEEMRATFTTPRDQQYIAGRLALIERGRSVGSRPDDRAPPAADEPWQPDYLRPNDAPPRD